MSIKYFNSTPESIVVLRGNVRGGSAHPYVRFQYIADISYYTLPDNSVP